MVFRSASLIPGRGWVANVALDETENYNIGDEISIGKIRWKILGVEVNCPFGKVDRQHVGLVLNPIGLEIPSK